jgi:hypothetical protein
MLFYDGFQIFYHNMNVMYLHICCSETDSLYSSVCPVSRLVLILHVASLR